MNRAAARSGMMFAAFPPSVMIPWKRESLRTVRRRAESAVHASSSASRALIPSCGSAAACAALPRNSTSSETSASMSGSSSSRSPGWYISAASTPAKSPARIRKPLPLPRSSAGQPKRRTRPGRSFPRSRRARNAPRAAVPMRLCPQAWPTPGSASYSPRMAMSGRPAPSSLTNAVSRPPAPRVTVAPSVSSASVSSFAAFFSSNASSGRSWMRSARSSSVLPRASTRSLTRFLSAATSIGVARLARGHGPRRQDELSDHERREDEDRSQRGEAVDRAQPEQRGNDRAALERPAQGIGAARSRGAPSVTRWARPLLPGECARSRRDRERHDEQRDRPRLFRIARKHDEDGHDKAYDDEQPGPAHLLRLGGDVERQHALLTARGERHLREPLDRARGARQCALGLVELLRGVIEVPAKLIVELDEALELTAHLPDALLQITGALLHREAAQAERHDLQVGHQGVW